jgi:hypothetical protein
MCYLEAELDPQMIRNWESWSQIPVKGGGVAYQSLLEATSRLVIKAIKFVCETTVM